MSGGSYDYLYLHLDDLSGRRKDLKRMYRRLAQLGHGDPSAATLRILDNLDAIEESAEALADVWRAVEWLDSGDSCEDQVTDVVREYRSQ